MAPDIRLDEPNPHPSTAVRVIVPVDVAFNLEKMQKVTASVLAHLGCPACHSGRDIRFDIERTFVVDKALNVRAPSEFLR